MKNNRRDFFRISGLAGLGLAGSSLLKAITPASEYNRNIKSGMTGANTLKTHVQKFNMSGYSAPRLDIVRIGFIGVGARGMSAVERMCKIEGIEIKAVCDKRAEAANRAKKISNESGHEPDVYSGSEDIWKKVCERNDIDLIYTATPWSLHTPIAVYSMEHDKHIATEVPAASTIDECWQLVETSERTKKHCMMLENCCYDFFELLILNMVRQGYFGEIVHCDCSYIHDLNDEVLWSKNRHVDLWQLKEISKRNGNLYPTHGFGPVCQVMDINRGDKLDYMVSLSSIDFMLANKARQLALNDDFYKPFVVNTYNGNMNTSIIKTHKGRSIMLQYDTTSPRPYTRIQMVSGTKASSLKYPLPGRISKGHEWVSDEEFKALEEKYTPPIIKEIGEMAKQVGGHGGMDFIMDWRLIDCLRNGLPLDQDVYDAALWSSITPLSEWSVANRSTAVDIPDFTCGSYKTNSPVNISMPKSSGTTR
ncbi:MAG: Gfo/Idh/MocA family oxidoreductase [Bacteroidales bacterium]|nr:Gfo/Idh/MocA family oxidoreductase [Bacteroidales bacterium]